MPYCIIIGPEEVKKKKVKIKNMDTGKEETVAIEKIKSFLTQ